MRLRNLCNIKYLGAIGALYAFDIAEISLVAALLAFAPAYALPILFLTQIVSLCANFAVAVFVWKKPAQRVLGLLQNRIATLGERGRSHRLSEGSN